MELKKCLSSVKLQFGLYFIVAIIVLVLNYVTILNATNFMDFSEHPFTQLGIALTLGADGLILLWAGYIVVKKLNVGYKEAGVTVALISLTVSAISISLDFLFVRPIVLDLPKNYLSAVVTNAIYSPIGLIGLWVIGAFLAFIIGLIGAFIAKH